MPSIGNRVQLSLDQLIPMNRQDQELQSVSRLFQTLCQPWPDSVLTMSPSFLELLPDLSTDYMTLLSGVPVWQGEPVQKVNIYVDGSSFAQEPYDHGPAAWAFIIILECNDDQSFRSRFLGAAAATLEGNMSSCTHGIGEASYDALASEAVAMIWVLSWAMQSQFSVPHVVFYDNCTIGPYAAGTASWNLSDKYEALGNILTALRHCLFYDGRLPTFSHLKAHSGEPWSEAVDSLAKAAAKGVLSSSPMPAEVVAVLRHRYLRYAWMSVCDTSTLPLPAAFRPTFSAEGPFLDNMKQHTDVTWWHATTQREDSQVNVSLGLATANVLTLDAGTSKAQHKGLFQMGRIATLQAQMAQTPYNLIGLQECRTQNQICRHSSTHYVYQSGATEQGTHGCELWVSRTIPYAQIGSEKCYFASDHVHIVSYSPRHLLAVLHAPHVHIRVLVIHGPHSHATDVDVEEWWAQLAQEVARSPTQVPLVVLGDTNAHIGSVTSSSISSLSADEENLPGHCLHAFALDSSLWIRATFESSHVGDSYTWLAVDGSQYRIDFVLLPYAWKSFDIESWVDYDLDLSTARQDHFATAVKVNMTVRSIQQPRQVKPQIDVRKCSDPSLRTQFCAYIDSFPPIPWGCGHGLHAELLTMWIQMGAQHFFKKDQALPRQRYMSDDTWHLVLLRKQLLKISQVAWKHVRQIGIQCLFLAWKHQVTGHPTRPGPLSPVSRHAFEVVQTKCEHVAWWAIQQRRALHGVARQRSRQDRLDQAQQLAQKFLSAASMRNTQAMYQALKPLLGQTHRKEQQRFRPVPAVKLPCGAFAPDAAIAAETWRSHFATAETGELVTIQQMQCIAHEQAAMYDPNTLTFDLDALPTLGDVENYIRKAKHNKAPGCDGLPCEVFQINPQAFGRILFPLLVKCSLHCNEPMRWRGGEIFALPKSQHARHEVEQYRSILLADFTSKIHHGLIRKQLLSSFQSYRLTMQAGGVPSFGTDMLNLHVQAFSHFCHRVSLSSACIFVDIKQAFYRACRPLLVCMPDIDNETLAQFFHASGWAPDIFHEFCQHMTAQSALDAAHVSSHQRAKVAGLLHGTWFSIRQCANTLTHTRAGTRRRQCG